MLQKKEVNLNIMQGCVFCSYVREEGVG